MTEESSSPARLDALAEHFSKDRPPLCLFDELFLDLLHLFQHEIARVHVFFERFDFDAVTVHLDQNLMNGLGSLQGALERRIGCQMVIGQSPQHHTVLIPQIVNLRGNRK